RIRLRGPPGPHHGQGGRPAAGGVTTRRRKFWGWGYEGEGLTADEMTLIARLAATRLGLDELRAQDPPEISEIELRRPRVTPPAAIATDSSVEAWDRAEPTLGKSFHDLVRGLRREYANPPDVVVYPTSEEELAAVLEWASDQRVAAIPYGGGSSVAGGIEP